MDLRSSDTSERNTQDRFTLPEWLRPDEPSEYEPPHDRDTFLRNNVLHMVGMLEVFRGGGFGSCLVARTVGRVDARLRILVTLLLAILVSAAQNMAFVWVMLIIVLIGLVLRPAGEISAILRPALVATVLAVCLSIPAIYFGALAAPLRLAGKTFTTTVLVLGLTRSLGAHGLVEAARRLQLPATAALVIDLAIRDLALLGQIAIELGQALALRSIGHNRDKSSSVAGLLATTYLKAHDLAGAQYEAMVCRGFDGLVTVPSQPVSHRSGFASFCYLAVVILIVAVFVWLEGAMG